MDIEIIRGENWPKADPIGWCDPYLVIYYEDKKTNKIHQTNVCKNTANPEWNELLRLEEGSGNVLIKCYDHDKLGNDDFLGTVEFEFPKLRRGKTKIFTLDVNLHPQYKEKRKDNTKETTIVLRFTDTRNIDY